MGTDLDSLADHVRGRRAALGWEREDVASRMEMNAKTVERIELSKSVRADTYARLEVALGWAPGSVRRILTGGEPTLLPSAAQPVADPKLLAVRELADCITQGGELGVLAKYWAGRLSDPDDIWGLIDEARALSEREIRESQEEGTERDNPRRHA